MNVTAIYKEGPDGNPMYHNLHREWFQSIGADEVTVPRVNVPGILKDSIATNVGVLLPPVPIPEIDADICVFESPGTLYALPALSRCNPDTMMVYLETNWRLYGLLSCNLNKHSLPKKFLRIINTAIDSAILKGILRKYIDGIITISPLMSDLISERVGGKPTSIVYPTTQQLFPEIDPDIEAKKAVFIGQGRDHKGVDRLVSNWSRVRDKHPSAKLSIVGANHPSEYSNIPGVERTGYVDDLRNPLSNASVYAHPARLDGFALTVIEAMSAGLPPVITSMTGSKTAVREVDDSLVVNSSGKSVTERISTYFDCSKPKKIRLSQRSKEVAEQWAIEERTELRGALRELKEDTI